MLYCRILSYHDIHAMVLCCLNFLPSLMSLLSQLEFQLSRAELEFGARLVNELSRAGSLINEYLRVESSWVELARYPPLVRPPWPTPGAAPSPIKTPRWEKPKDPINFPETYRDPPPSSTRDREGPEALLGTLPERGIATGGLLHCHACLRRDEWVVYLGLWVHSSS
jgi:hypothetical protein